MVSHKCECNFPIRKTQKIRHVLRSHFRIQMAVHATAASADMSWRSLENSAKKWGGGGAMEILAQGAIYPKAGPGLLQKQEATYSILMVQLRMGQDPPRKSRKY